MPLVNASHVMSRLDPILQMIAKANGNSQGVFQIDTGVYEIGHFGSSNWPPGFATHGPCGVCDTYEQVLEHHKDVISQRESIVTLTPIERSKQSPEGGWRWHKWGEYIGTKKPTQEYLYDEPEIEKVYVYHVYFKECTGPHQWEGMYGRPDSAFKECKYCGEQKYEPKGETP